MLHADVSGAGTCVQYHGFATVLLAGADGIDTATIRDKIWIKLEKRGVAPDSMSNVPPSWLKKKGILLSVTLLVLTIYAA